MSRPEPDGASRLPSAIQAEIRQRVPFATVAQEATVALLRTASLVERAIARVVEPSGISLPQYNVLRILRGAGADGLPTLAIRDRMLDANASITRLVDKLEGAGLVRRARTALDRRQVRCTITPAGLALLATLDAPVDAADTAALSGLDAAGHVALLALLDDVRAGLAASGPADRPPAG